MPLSFKLTQDAEDDLSGIRKYTIEKWGVDRSTKYLVNLQKTIQFLADSPSIGTNRSDVGDDIQSFPCQKHTIYYIQHKGHLVVFAVLHQSMIPANHLNSRNW